MTEVMQWTGGERRSGDDRRTRFEAWADDRRREERRRGGVGTRHPDPTEALLNGMEVPATLAFEPRDVAPPTAGDDAGISHMPLASEPEAVTSGLAKSLAPAHEPHDAIPSAAAIVGHPLHPSVVPLPIGAFVGALAADLAYLATKDAFFARAARLLTGAGLITGALAAVLGGIDFLTRSQIRSHRAAWLHAGGNAATLLLGGLSLGLRTRGDRASVAPAALALSLVSGLVLLVTGWLGGELSYRHRIGVTDSEGGA
jgi:uncharacterized membrane protein